MAHHHDELPRITALDEATMARARTVTVHSPGASSADGDLVWTLTIADADGDALCRDLLAAPDCPTPLGEVVAPHLDLAGLRVCGRWRTDLGEDQLPRHRADVEPAV